MGRSGPDGGDGPLDARKARLLDLLEDIGMKTIRYLYDFGDGWEHTIKIERIMDAVPGIAYPRLVEAAGRCPPEDVGGPSGYAEILEAIDDPTHDRHAEVKEWIEDDFDPKSVDTDRRADALTALANAWSRKSPARRARPA
jgi:hypothetical protein